jgi:integrase
VAKGRRQQKAISRRAPRAVAARSVEKAPARSSSSRPRGSPFAAVSPARLAEWIGDYLAELAATEHRGRTLDTYRKALLRLRPELRAAATDGAFLRAIARLAPSTRALYLSTARGFDAWCVETGRTRTRALAGRARVKLDQVAPKPFEPEELQRLDATAAAWRGRGRYRELAARTRLLYLILQESGCRIEDALALRWRDVVLDVGREALRLQAPKGRAAQLVPLLPGLLLQALRAAERDRGRRLAQLAGDVAGDVAGGGRERLGRKGLTLQSRVRFPVGSPAYVLAVDEQGARPWSYRAALVAFQQLAERAGVVDATPHRMRHSRATELVESGATTWALQRAMGWKKLETASRYVRFTDAQLRAELVDLARRRP